MTKTSITGINICVDGGLTLDRSGLMKQAAEEYDKLDMGPVTGDVSGATGDVTACTGHMSGISGDVSGGTGDMTGGPDR